MPLRPTKISIFASSSGLKIIGSEDIGCRKSEPNVSQKFVESEVKRIHDCVKKFSSYTATAIALSPIDYYDEGYDHYTISGASMSKGDRKPRDRSWEKTSIPKDWTMHTRIDFGACQKTSAPIEAALKALGASGVDVKLVQKEVKRKGLCVLSARYRRGSWGETILDSYVIGNNNDE